MNRITRPLSVLKGEVKNFRGSLLEMQERQWLPLNRTFANEAEHALEQTSTYSLQEKKRHVRVCSYNVLADVYLRRFTTLYEDCKEKELLLLARNSLVRRYQHC